MPKYVIKKIYTTTLLADTKQDAERTAEEAVKDVTDFTISVNRFKSPKKNSVNAEEVAAVSVA